MEGDMTPLSGIPSSSTGYPRLLLVWFCIQRPSNIFMLRMGGGVGQKNISSQRTLIEDLKLWSLVKL